MKRSVENAPSFGDCLATVPDWGTIDAILDSIPDGVSLETYAEEFGAYGPESANLADYGYGRRALLHPGKRAPVRYRGN